MKGAAVRLLEERRRQLDTEMEQLRIRRAEIDFMISRALGETVEPPSPDDPPKRRRNVKKTVLELMEIAGGEGATATEIVDRARTLGRELDRGSVSSLLSKFKADGVLIFDGERYYLASKTPTPPDSHPFRVVNGAKEA